MSEDAHALISTTNSSRPTTADEKSATEVVAVALSTQQIDRDCEQTNDEIEIMEKMSTEAEAAAATGSESTTAVDGGGGAIAVPTTASASTATTAHTAPVTPKSFHSTRSSFKKSSLPAVSHPPSVSQHHHITTTAGGSHIYDYPSSLNSSRSSLHQHHHHLLNVTNQEIPIVTASAQATTTAHADVMITTVGINDVVDLDDAEIISFTDANIIVKEPIVIRGAGNLTIFGVCNKFSEQFPSALNAKLAPEEFRDTIKQINSILNKELENSFKWLVVGSLFCCCTLGCSLLPVIYLNKKAKLCINKLLDIENHRLYNKLGLRWRLTKFKCNSNSLFEYVLLVEFLPLRSLYQPD